MSKTNKESKKEGPQTKKVKVDNVIKPMDIKPLYTEKDDDDDSHYIPSSQAFRSTSLQEYEYASQLVDYNMQSAQAYSEANNVSIEDALHSVIPDYEDVMWQNVTLEKSDSKVGDIITSKKISICCNSMIVENIYNDTIVLSKNGKVATFLETNSNVMTHSGDKYTEYGLKHTITFTPENDNEQYFYVITAPWKNNKASPIETLQITQPILEIRTEDHGEKKRFIIPQDFRKSNASATACINAVICYKNNEWSVCIHRDLIKGFAENIPLLKSEISKLVLE